MALHNTPHLTGGINYNDFNSNILHPYLTFFILHKDGTQSSIEFTDYVVDISNLNLQGENEIFSNFTESSDITIKVVKELNDTNKIFAINDPDNTNVFQSQGWGDGTYTSIRINFHLLDSPSGTPLKSMVLFEGKVFKIDNEENTLTLNIGDGLVEGKNKKGMIGRSIYGEKISYKDRFFVDYDNQLSGLDVSDIYGGWDLQKVKQAKEYNIKNIPIIKPERTLDKPTIKGYVKRFHDKRGMGSIYSSLDDWEKLKIVDKVGADNSLSYERAEVNYESGILSFEVPPLQDPNGFIYLEHYKTPYRYKHPSFLAKKMFELLGYNSDHIKEEKINPHFPNVINHETEYTEKNLNKYGQIAPNQGGKNYGAKTISYCDQDGLFYYFSKGGIYRTDLKQLNEKIINTKLDIVDMDLFFVEDTPNFLRIIVTAKNYKTSVTDTGQKVHERIPENPFCYENTTTKNFPFETFSLTGTDTASNRKLPDRDLLATPTTFSNDWLNDSCVTLHYYDFHFDEGFQNTTCWINEKNVYESEFSFESESTVLGGYLPEIKKFVFPYDAKVYKPISKTNDGVSDFYHIIGRVVIDNERETKNYPDGITVSDHFVAHINKFVVLTDGYFTGNVSGQPYYYTVQNTDCDPGQSSGTASSASKVNFDRQGVIVDLKYTYNELNGTWYAEWIDGFPSEYKIGNKITWEGNESEDFQYEYWSLNNIDCVTTFNDTSTDGWKNNTKNLIQFLDEEKLKPKRVLSLEGEDEFDQEGFLEILTNKTAPNELYSAHDNHTQGYIKTSFVSGSVYDKEIGILREEWDSPSRCYIFGNDLTNNFVISKVSKKIYFLAVDRKAQEIYKEENKNQQLRIYSMDIDDSSFDLKSHFLNWRDNGILPAPGSKGLVVDWHSDPHIDSKILKNFSEEEPMSLYFIGADILLEDVDNTSDNIYLLINDRIIRLQTDNTGDWSFNNPKGSGGGVYNEPHISFPYEEDRQFMRTFSNTDVLDWGIISSESLFGKTSMSANPVGWIDYNYLFTSSGDRIKCGSTLDKVLPNYMDLHGEVKEENHKTLSQFNTSLQQGESNESDHWFYSMHLNEGNNRIETSHRVHQVYGLNKVKKNNQITDTENSSGIYEHIDQPKFSFYAVNRDYLFQNIWEDYLDTKRYNEQDGEFALKYRRTFKQGEQLYYPRLGENEQYIKSGFSVNFIVDFTTKGHLKNVNKIMPVANNEKYNNFIDKVTQEFDQLYFSVQGKKESSVIASKVGAGISTAFKDLLPVGVGIKSYIDPEITTTGNEIEIIVTQKLGDLRQGGYWDKFKRSPWFNDILMIYGGNTPHIAPIGAGTSKFPLNLWKSQYISFSIEKNISESHFGKDKIIRFNLGYTNTKHWANIFSPPAPSEYRLNPLRLLDNFHELLISLRRDFISKNILNSLLPKTSKNIGENIVTVIGNYGEYLTTTDLLSPPSYYLDNFKSVNKEDYLDTHGSLNILSKHFVKNDIIKKDGLVKLSSKGFPHIKTKDKVYKDFVCKPIHIEVGDDLNEQRIFDEMHFMVGQSIGYDKLVVESKWKGDSELPPKQNSSSIFNTIFNKSFFADELMNYRLYDPENMMWCSLEKYIEPRIPYFDYSESTIYEALEKLASILDYKFGVKNGIPFFEEKEPLFRIGEIKGDTLNSPKIKCNVPTNEDYIEGSFDVSGFKKGSYYFITGEIIQIDYSDEIGILGEKVHRCVENSSHDFDIISGNSLGANIIEEDLEINGNVYADIKRLGNSSLLNASINIYEIVSVANDKNIINISGYNKLYTNEYTDYNITYGNDKEYKKIINYTEDFKNTFSIDLPEIEDSNLIKYIGQKIERQTNVLRYKLDISLKLNPTITNGDHIAVFDERFKIGRVVHSNKTDTGSANPITLKSYKLFKVLSVNHNFNSFASEIVCYSVSTNSTTLSIE